MLLTCLFQVFSTKLNKQNHEFKDETESKFSYIAAQLRAQKTTEDKQRDDIDTLKSDTAGTCVIIT